MGVTGTASAWTPTENGVKEESSAFHEGPLSSRLSCLTQERAPGTDPFPENVSLANTVPEDGTQAATVKIDPVMTCDPIALSFTRCKQSLIHLFM